MLRIFSVTVLILFNFISSLEGQDSFQITTDSLGLFLFDAIPDEFGNLGLVLFGSLKNTDLYFLNLDSTNEKGIGRKYNIENAPFDALLSKVVKTNDKYYIRLSSILSNTAYLAGIGINNSDHWVRKLGNSDFVLSTIQVSEENLFLVKAFNRIQNTGVEGYFFDKENGFTKLKKGYTFRNFSFGSDFSNYIEGISTLNGNLYCSLSLKDEDSDLNHGAILKINKYGEPIEKIVILNKNSVQHFISPDNYIYLLGVDKENYPFTENQSNAFITKIDTNLNLVWSKVFHSEKFEHKRATLNFKSDGSPILAYSTLGAYPVILATLNQNGDVISEKGYPLFNPKIHVLSDGALILQTNTHFDKSGNTFLKNIIAKTDPEGNIDGCETYPAFLKSTDIQIETGKNLTNLPSPISATYRHPPTPISL